MTSSKSILVAASAALLALLASTGEASAQRTAQDIASARRLYNEGIELREKGDMKGALEKLKAAHALGNTPITGLELCRAHAAVGQPVEAREACLAVGRIPPSGEETQRSKEARADAASLAEAERARIGFVRVTLKGVPDGAQPTVVIDGASVPVAALAEPRAVNPGSHTIVASIAGGPETRATLETREGETRAVELEVEAPPAGAPTAPTPATSVPTTQKPKEKSNGFATASLIAAGVAGGVGAVAGLVALSKEGDLDKACEAKICGKEQWDALDSANTWGVVSTTFFIIGGVALGTGVVASLVGKSGSSSAAAAPKASTASAVRITPVLGVGGAGLHGSF